MALQRGRGHCPFARTVASLPCAPTYEWKAKASVHLFIATLRARRGEQRTGLPRPTIERFWKAAHADRQVPAATRPSADQLIGTADDLFDKVALLFDRPVKCSGNLILVQPLHM
ncbi:hypothetical protein ASE05_29555 [Mesorhizobium sp. Root172]|nr:hypothetical protein ASE05_29555 [Mesorhizobium sp. Root172]